SLSMRNMDQSSYIPKILDCIEEIYSYHVILKL
ncbi:LysR family transcriptional regulator, partial [Acinetobacter baumannii]|nr:LysR family transcriptional regulator [Acinetobacter baumannii]